MRDTAMNQQATLEASGTRDGKTYEVDPARLAHGKWSHDLEVQIGEGDIVAAYSADLIGMAGRIRRPFTFRSGLWTCVGISNVDTCMAQVYRLVAVEAFAGTPTTYAVKTRDADAARSDPAGFYHGMAVRYGGLTYVITGPPVELVPGQVAQASLFGCL